MFYLLNIDCYSVASNPFAVMQIESSANNLLKNGGCKFAYFCMTKGKTDQSSDVDLPAVIKIEVTFSREIERKVFFEHPNHIEFLRKILNGYTIRLKGLPVKIDKDFAKTILRIGFLEASTQNRDPRISHSSLIISRLVYNWSEIK